MQIIILNDKKSLSPFNERARDLRIQNKPLWLIQRDLLSQYSTKFSEFPSGSTIPEIKGPCLIFRDNLFFDSYYIDNFIKKAQKRKSPSRAAFSLDDNAFREHAFPLSNSYDKVGDFYMADLWYYPDGTQDYSEPLLIDLQSQEIGYYHVPTYIVSDQGDLVFQVPLQCLLAIDSWVHIFIADVVFGLFSRGARFENQVSLNPFYKLKILGKALYEGEQVLSTSELVKIGKDCIIHPSATISGPTIIGDNVTIGAGVVIDNCIIGNNVNISQGCQLLLSVVGDGAFLPFRGSLFMTTLMDHSIVAQNTCLQMSVIGRNTFIGAGCTFTDFNLLPTPLRARDANGKLSFSNREVLGGCVGHNCRIGSGMIVMPGRTIESDVVLIGSKDRRIIDKDISFEQSDHHNLNTKNKILRRYPQIGEDNHISW